MGVRWREQLHTAQRRSGMRELPHAEAADRRNFLYIGIHRVLHRMGPQASDLAKEAGLCRPGPRRQASPADRDVAGPGDGDRL